MARKLMTFFWAGTLIFLILMFVVGFLSKDEGAVIVWYPMAGMIIFGACAMGSTLAWIILRVRGITQPPTSNPAVENGRSEQPSAVHRER